MIYLEAAMSMLVPPKEEENLTSLPPSEELVGNGELQKLLKSKQNHDARHANQSGADVNANLTRPLDVYALSEGCTTWKRVNGYQESAFGATCVEEADEILIG